ncbi:MAG: archaeal preflagellin peptidase FlaK [Methanothermococcus sp.]|jgi:preflagellin peptidase FlaK|nr:archaeal preflagellin peptidase FlaK [Methanothermococcus sp.]MDK2987193.1 archaeal preflagellin peptidase FlaK [Methanothermococcus sp.]
MILADNMFGYDSILVGVYLFNLILLGVATITDIKERIIPHFVVILMLLVNLPIGYYYFGFDAIIAFFATLLLCLILGVGMGGGDVKIFTALSPIFAYETQYYVPNGILLLIGLSAAFAAFFPMLNIFKRYWKEIVPSSAYLATVLSFIIYLTDFYHIKYAKLIVWAYVIISIFVSRKIKNYKDITRKIGYVAPIYLLGLYVFDNGYFIQNNVLTSFLIYVGELIILSIVIYAITGAEVSSKKSVEELKEGDILRDIITIKDDGNVVVENANLIKRFKQMVYDELRKSDKTERIILTDGEGLSNEDIDLIKNLYKNGKVPKELNILKTYPFVPFVLLSYMVIIALHFTIK